MSAVIIIGSDVERTPEDEYRGAAMWARETAAARDTTRDVLDKLDLDAIYHVYEGPTLTIHQAQILKATAKQYRLHYMGSDYTISRAPIDAGEIAGSGWRRFALGRAIQPRLQQQLTEQTAVAERCDRRMQEKRQALQ